MEVNHKAGPEGGYEITKTGENSYSLKIFSKGLDPNTPGPKIEISDLKNAPEKIESRFLAGEVIDLVGAGDSFRAGFISYIARNIEDFKNSRINFAEAVQMGNLFASLYIKAGLDDRYGNIGSFDNMLKIVQNGLVFDSFANLVNAVKA